MGKKNKYKQDEKKVAAPAPAAAPAAAPAPQPQQPQQQQQKQTVTAAAGPMPSTSAAAAQVQGQRGGSQQAGGYEQRPAGDGRGPPGQQRGGDPQRGTQKGQQGAGYQQQQHRQYGGQQGGYQQRGPAPQQGGYQQRGPAPQQGGYQQRGPAPQQGGYQQSGPAPQQGGYQQRGPAPQQGGYQQRGAAPQQGGAIVSQLPQTGSIKRGTIGRPGTVGVNYLNVDLTKMPQFAYHYDVDITPDRPKKFYRNAFEVFRTKYLEQRIAAFDGSKSCYALDELPCVSGEVEVLDKHSRTLKYTVTVKKTDNTQVDLGSLHSYMKDKIYEKPMRALQCLEVVLASCCHQRSVRAGRSYFKTSGNGVCQELGDGYEALVGLYQSLVLGDRPFINVDVSHKSFPIAMTLIEYLENYGQMEPLKENTTIPEFSLRKILSFIKGINVVYEPPKSFGNAPRVYKVNGFSQHPARSEKFKCGDDIVTVEAYFKSRSYKLKYPMLQCLSVGHPSKISLLPIELCRIEEGQALNRKDGANQVSQMIKFAATATHERKAKIMDLLKYFQHNLDPTISRFGLTIGDDFITVNTRLLNAPQLEYRNSKFATPMNGAWRMDRNQYLTRGPKVHKWAILHCESGHMQYNKIIEFQTMILRQAMLVDVTLESEADIRSFKDDRNLDMPFNDLKSKKCDLVFVILPSRNATYEMIKQRAELHCGILTQCIKQNNVERRLNDQLIGNLLLKVNSKLNGINHKIKDDARIRLANVMYLGADVTHPSPDQRDIPSVVGVAASHDLHGGSYNMQVRLQINSSGRPREEIDDMQSITSEHLRVYNQKQGRYPDHIIYYRDGVSDGQFLKIKNLELRGIYAACDKVRIKPKICCVIVVKRHHTRFFPLGTPHFRNKYNNVDPGTVVDRIIVHPNEVQFFMVSHQSIQGTAKPTRYNVIENTGNLDIDLLQQLTYNLCHMFPRCNRAVSYPAPAYLAHLAAARGRVYITGHFNKPKNSPVIHPEFLKTNPMYFV